MKLSFIKQLNQIFYLEMFTKSINKIRNLKANQNTMMVIMDNKYNKFLYLLKINKWNKIAIISKNNIKLNNIIII